MDELETLAMMIGNDGNDLDDDYLQLLLDRAEYAIMNKRYPFLDWSQEDGEGNRLYPLEPRYKHLQLEIAVVLYNKRGWEGENSHTENGVTRTAQSGGDIPDALLGRVTPLGKLM